MKNLGVEVVGFSEQEQAILASFHHHRPTPEQTERIMTLRRVYRDTAIVVMRAMEPSADRTAALRQLHESMMTANKAIACEAPAEPLGT